MKKIGIFLLIFGLWACKKQENVEPEAPSRENTYFRIVNASDKTGTIDIYQYYYNVLSKIADSLYVSKSLPQNQYLKSQVPDEKTNEYPEFILFFTSHPSQDTMNYKFKFQDLQLKANTYQTFFLADKGGNTELLRFEDNVSFADSSDKFAIRLVNLDPSGTQDISVVPSDTNLSPLTLSAGSFNVSNEVKLPQGKYTINSGGNTYSIEIPKKKYIQFVITPSRKFVLY